MRAKSNNYFGVMVSIDICKEPLLPARCENPHFRSSKYRPRDIGGIAKALMLRPSTIGLTCGIHTADYTLYALVQGTLLCQHLPFNERPSASILKYLVRFERANELPSGDFKNVCRVCALSCRQDF